MGRPGEEHNCAHARAELELERERAVTYVRNHKNTCFTVHAAACLASYQIGLKMSKKRSVLVSYLERNKVFSLEGTPPEGDIPSLKKDFIQQFKFEPNVRLDITFHRYDTVWEEFVELDEDARVEDRERLKAIVTPILAVETPCQSEVDTLSEVS